MKKKRTSYKARNRSAWFCVLGYSAMLFIFHDPLLGAFLCGFYTALAVLEVLAGGASLLMAHQKHPSTLMRLRTLKKQIVMRQVYIRSAVILAAAVATGHPWLATAIAATTLLPIVVVVSVPTYYQYRLSKA